MSYRRLPRTKHRRIRFEPLEDRRMLSVSPEWLVTLGGDASVQLHYAAGHVAGGFSVAGHFDSTQDFDPGPNEWLLSSGTAPFSGYPNVVVARYTDAGSLDWAAQTHSNSLNHFQFGTGVATDRDGNTYVLGVFSGSVKFKIGLQDKVFTGDARDGFVAKLDADGNFVWAQPLRATSSDLSPRDFQGIAVDDRDDDRSQWSVFVSGQFSGTLTVGEGGPSYSSTGKKSASNADGFVAKLSADDGDVAWTRLFIGNGNQTPTALAVAKTGTPALYVSGDFSTEAKIGGVTLTGPAGSHFLAQLDPLDPSNGATIWAKRVAVSATFGSFDTADDGVVVAGDFSGTNVDFDPSPGGVQNLSSAGARDIGLLKLDAGGNFAWARRMGGAEDELTRAVSVDANGHVFVTGQFGGLAGNPADFGSSQFLIPNGPDGFLAELDAAGSFLTTSQFSDGGFAIAEDGNGNIYVTGSFSGLEYKPFSYPFDHFPTGLSVTTQRQGASLMKFSSTAPTIDMSPRIDDFRATREKVAAPEEGELVKLSVVGVHDPDRHLRSVKFYRDIDGDGVLNLAADELLGEVSTPTNEQERSTFAGLIFSASFPDLPAESHKYIAQAFDSNGDLLTEPAVATVPVIDFSAYSSLNVPKAIPDPGTVSSTLNVPDSFTILDLNVALDITHTYTGDLRARLKSPDGTQVLLFSGYGSSGDNLHGTVFDDEAATPIWDKTATPPFTGSFSPSQSLSVFDGKKVTGVWTLEITDAFRRDKGTLNSWSLNFTREAAPMGLAAGQAAALEWETSELPVPSRKTARAFVPLASPVLASETAIRTWHNLDVLPRTIHAIAVSGLADRNSNRPDASNQAATVDAALDAMEFRKWPRIADQVLPPF
jgi:subtilisin-like proprotein convertase family protein